MLISLQQILRAAAADSVEEMKTKTLKRKNNKSRFMVLAEKKKERELGSRKMRKEIKETAGINYALNFFFLL